MFRHVLAVLLLGPCAALVAHAIGDSGSCGSITQQALGKALKDGTPQEVDSAIAQWVDRDAPTISLTYSRPKAILSLIQATYTKVPPCSPNAPLIYYALDAGNVEVVRHLLGKPLGVTPNVPLRVLFNCEHSWYSPPAPPAARLRAYEVLLELNVVDVNAAPDGMSVLGRCKDPDLLALFLKHGARPDVDVAAGRDRMNYLEVAMRDALLYDEDSYTAQREHALERIKLFSQYMPASIEGRSYQRYSRGLCARTTGGKPWNPKTCKALQQLVRGAPPSTVEE